MKITLIFIGVYSKLNKTNVTRNVIKVKTFYRLEDINRKKNPNYKLTIKIKK